MRWMASAVHAQGSRPSIYGARRRLRRFGGRGWPEVLGGEAEAEV